MSGNNKQSTGSEYAARLMHAIAASSNVVGPHAGPPFIPGPNQHNMVPSFAGNQFLAPYMPPPGQSAYMPPPGQSAYMPPPDQSYSGHSLQGHAPFWGGLVPGLTGHPAYQNQPIPGQAMGMSTLVTSEEHDSLRAEHNELKKSNDTLAVALESTQKTLRAVAKQANAVKQTDGMFKIHAQSIIAAQPKPKKAAIAGPIYVIRTTEGQAAYDHIIADYAANNLKPDRAIKEGLRVAEEVDEETLMAGSSGAAAAAVITPKEIWAELTNKGIQIRKDLLAYARKCNHKIAANARTLPAKLLAAFEDNDTAYGFGFVQFTADPFTAATPAEVSAFEDFKSLNSLPSGVWDGVF